MAPAILASARARDPDRSCSRAASLLTRPAPPRAAPRASPPVAPSSPSSPFVVHHPYASTACAVSDDAGAASCLAPPPRAVVAIVALRARVGGRRPHDRGGRGG